LTQKFDENPPVHGVDIKKHAAKTAVEIFGGGRYGGLGAMPQENFLKSMLKLHIFMHFCTAAAPAQ